MSSTENHIWLLSKLKLLVMIILTHWGWLTHICISELTTIGSDNGLSPGQRQAIIWKNAGEFQFEP